MSLETLNKKIVSAKKILESAATVSELAREQNSTSFTVPKNGILTGQLIYSLRSNADPKVEVTDAGSNWIIKSINPRAVAKELKTLGLAADVEGEVEDKLANPDDIASQGSTNGTVGESFIKKAKKILKSIQMR